tara:strand:- start:669 stop:1367 length:699 start_codon:yes stop_codon:yes gene_type:complete
MSLNKDKLSMIVDILKRDPNNIVGKKGQLSGFLEVDDLVNLGRTSKANNSNVKKTLKKRKHVYPLKKTLKKEKLRKQFIKEYIKPYQWGIDQMGLVRLHKNYEPIMGMMDVDRVGTYFSMEELDVMDNIIPGVNVHPIINIDGLIGMERNIIVKLVLLNKYRDHRSMFRNKQTYNLHYYGCKVRDAITGLCKRRRPGGRGTRKKKKNKKKKTIRRIFTKKAKKLKKRKSRKN